MTTTQRIAILGASGYTGAELIRLLLMHPFAKIRILSGDSQAGKMPFEVYPHLHYLDLPRLISLDQVDYKDIDIVFCCLPHGTTQEVIATLPRHVRIIDLSADFRLRDVDEYARWYGDAEHYGHRAPALQKEAVYGLTEHARDAVKKARLVADPGCYPTSAQLPLVPLIKAGLIGTDNIVIDAKSGVTGRGRSVKQDNIFTEINEGISAYGIGKHRHTPEIEQGLSEAAGKQVIISFTPHLMPMNRGILSTIYVTLATGASVPDLRATLTKAYEHEYFVKLLLEDVAPSTHMVHGTNFCFMNVFKDRLSGRAIIVSAIDNLVKGASGQAVQNMNVMCGYPETTALTQTALFP